MNKRLDNRNRMIMAAVSVLNKFRNLWENIPVFVTIVNEINAIQTQIDQLRNITESDMTGKTRDKNELEKRLVHSVYTISSSISVMARRNGNHELLEKVDFTLSELAKARDAQLLSICEGVIALARQQLNLLTGSGIAEEDITALENLVGEMREIIVEPRVSISERKAANERLQEEIDKAVNILDEQTDLLMTRYKLSNPDFFAEYMNARHIVAYGVRHESEEDAAA